MGYDRMVSIVDVYGGLTDYCLGGSSRGVGVIGSYNGSPDP